MPFEIVKLRSFEIIWNYKSSPCLSNPLDGFVSPYDGHEDLPREIADGLIERTSSILGKKASETIHKDKNDDQ